MVTQDGIKLEEVEKGVKNKNHFKNQFLGKGKYKRVRSVRCIQAMCIQIMYQISIYAFIENRMVIKLKCSEEHKKMGSAGKNKRGKMQKAYRFLRRKVLKKFVEYKTIDEKKLATVFQKQFGYGMLCKYLVRDVTPNKIKDEEIGQTKEGNGMNENKAILKRMEIQEQQSAKHCRMLEKLSVGQAKILKGQCVLLKCLKVVPLEGEKLESKTVWQSDGLAGKEKTEGEKVGKKPGAVAKTESERYTDVVAPKYSESVDARNSECNIDEQKTDDMIPLFPESAKEQNENPEEKNENLKTSINNELVLTGMAKVSTNTERNKDQVLSETVSATSEESDSPEVSRLQQLEDVKNIEVKTESESRKRKNTEESQERPEKRVKKTDKMESDGSAEYTLPDNESEKDEESLLIDLVDDVSVTSDEDD